MAGLVWWLFASYPVANFYRFAYFDGAEGGRSTGDLGDAAVFS
ncbi:hypothetical protein OH686_22750 [Pseudomonas sp. SO81]|nr:hypothetical protein OH686_22750 [Pseudomonas sp. SO81]